MTIGPYRPARLATTSLQRNVIAFASLIALRKILSYGNPPSHLSLNPGHMIYHFCWNWRRSNLALEAVPRSFTHTGNHCWTMLINFLLLKRPPDPTPTPCPICRPPLLSDMATLNQTGPRIRDWLVRYGETQAANDLWYTSYVYMCVCVHMCLYVCVCMWACMWMCVYTYIYIYIYRYIFISIIYYYSSFIYSSF